MVPELPAERRPIWIITRSDGDALTDAIEGTGTARTSADDPIAQRRGGVSTGEKQLAVDGHLSVGTSARALPDESPDGPRGRIVALVAGVDRVYNPSITCG